MFSFLNLHHILQHLNIQKTKENLDRNSSYGKILLAKDSKYVQSMQVWVLYEEPLQMRIGNPHTQLQHTTDSFAMSGYSIWPICSLL